MGRAERRRAQKCEQKAKTATYNLTRAQLDALVREKISGELDRVKQEATNDAINQAMILLLTLPLEVLMDHYWPKSYAKRIPEFTEHVLEYYEKWQNDELDMDKLKEDLWVYGGVRLEEVEGKQMGYLILGIIILAAILIFGGYVVLSVMNAAMWMDDPIRWGGRDDS